MQTVIKSPRNGCGLHGALQTVQGIRGLVPIVHANAGCAVQNYLAGKAGGAGMGSISGASTFSTDVQERHVIFGGASRLREQIKNTIKVAEGDLYIVLNSCESAMVGDDVEAMTREAREQGEAVVECLTAGFHGDSHYGYESVMTDLVKKLPQIRPAADKRRIRLVNLLGILPGQDICFRGDLTELKRILQGIGAEVNCFFGPENGVEELVTAPNASLNLVFSKWGRKAAAGLEERYNIPSLEFASVPTGPQEVAAFVHAVAEKLPLDERVIRCFLQEEEDEFRYYYRGLVDHFYEELAGKSVAVVGDESTVLRVGGFLTEYLGASVETAVVTDYFGKAENSREEKSGAVTALAREAYFTQDSKEIQDILVHSDVELILGSSLEQPAADKRQIVSLEVSYPVYDKAVVNKSYAGNRGALTLIEDYLTAVKTANRLKEQRLYAYINNTAG
ncbi:MAG: nitrogenase molybdenum-iron protein [Lachnospiraceae bacterium]|nr:nitrogenase molybdenum-iron protein [Lachnospiraceae bacterium]